MSLVSNPGVIRSYARAVGERPATLSALSWRLLPESDVRVGSYGRPASGRFVIVDCISLRASDCRVRRPGRRSVANDPLSL